MTDLIEIALLCVALWYTFSTNKLLNDITNEQNEQGQ